MVVPRGHPRIVVRNDADFPHGCRGTSAQADTNFPCGGVGSSVRIRVENGGNQKANFVHNNRLKDRETHRKDHSNIYALGYLCLTFAEFRTEPANCSAQNPLIVRVDIRGRRAAICRLSVRSSAEKV